MPKPDSVAPALRSELKQFSAVAVKVLLFSMVLNLLVLTVPIYMMQVYDRVIPTRHLETLLFLSLIAVGAVALYILLDTVRTHVLIKVGHQLMLALRSKVLFACVQSTAAGHNIGKQPVDELESVRLCLSGAAFCALFDLPWLVLFIGIVWIVHPVLGVFALSAVIVMAGITAISSVVVRNNIVAGRSADAQSDRFGSAIVESASTVMSMALWPRAQDFWKNLQTKGLKQKLPAELDSATFKALTKGSRTLIQIGALGIGAFLASSQEITPGAIIAVSILLNRALAPVDALVSGWRQFANAFQVSKQVNNLLRTYPVPTDKVNLPAPRGEIHFEQVTYLPAGRKKATLSGISIRISAGKTVAVVGASGSGKTTFCKTLLGYLPLRSGNVRIDGASLSDWNLKDLAPHVGYVSQHSEYLPGTVEQNIARFTPDRSLEVIEAAKLAGVHELILALPQGYQTVLDKNGAPLSGGQQQRIALARAIIGKPRILVLDEPNANLDADGMIVLSDILATVKSWGTTIVMAVHNTALFAHADQILVLEHGCVAAFGPREDILQRMRPDRSKALHAREGLNAQR
ncbi:ATP-binding cassette, subfamily C, exporter for protease/lipase [Thalassospira xiamenensis]|uniref:ATP-binding cassette, subfamily C, exporter for protease/lipase n=2 Tax=Thalassospira xiamenensis TaxID=220697 RepID=A0A285TQS5_9PROT|nr:ATP-binding cassette, subfamily C, exporter for protease/lipase [Thalassospira xiamenensis]